MTGDELTAVYWSFIDPWSHIRSRLWVIVEESYCWSSNQSGERKLEVCQEYWPCSHDLWLYISDSHETNCSGDVNPSFISKFIEYFGTKVNQILQQRLCDMKPKVFTGQRRMTSLRWTLVSFLMINRLIVSATNCLNTLMFFIIMDDVSEEAHAPDMTQHLFGSGHCSVCLLGLWFCTVRMDRLWSEPSSTQAECLPASLLTSWDDGRRRGGSQAPSARLHPGSRFCQVVIGSVGFAPSAVSLCGSNRWLVDASDGFFQLTLHEVRWAAASQELLQLVLFVRLVFLFLTELPAIDPKTCFHSTEQNHSSVWPRLRCLLTSEHGSDTLKCL